MPRRTSQKKIIFSDYEQIKEFLMGKSESIIEYLEKNPYMEYALFAKYITHSDLISKGKRTEKQGYDKNYLYYLTTEEMEEREELDVDRNGIDELGNDRLANIRTDSTAHQSNITVPTFFYEFFEITNKNKEKQEKVLRDNQKQLIISDVVDVYLVNDSLKYFDIEYTKKAFEKLGKEPNWDYDKYKIVLSDSDFTKIHLTEASHGIGTNDDVEFQKLRMSIFLNDKLILLMARDKSTNKKELFILLEKNPRFFTILGEYNSTWEQYLIKKYNREIFEYSKQEIVSTEVEKTRKDQSKWRKQLAEEMMNFTKNSNEIFCPLTKVTVDFEKAGTLFRASHIKAYKDCTLEEAYDINNGILMVANADALFDKHLITIDDEGNIIFSYLIDQDFKLKCDLLLTGKVFKYVLTPKRKEYLKNHRQVFEAKELERKRGVVEEDCSEENLL